MRRCIECNALEDVPSGVALLPPDWSCPQCGWRPATSDGIVITAPELADSMTGMNPGSFSDLAAVEDGHFWFDTRRQLLTGLANRYFPSAQDYLEIGCGNGYVLDSIRRSRSWRRLAGTELHPTALRYARQRTGASTELLQVDARKIPVRANFDLVGAYDVIEHIEEDEVVLAEIRDALRPGGGALITVPQHPWLWSGMDDIAFHKRRYRLGELELKARNAGFDVLRSTSFNMLLMPLTALNRLSEKLSRQSGEAACHFDAELKPNRYVNSALKAVLSIEIFGTLHGLTWPVGTSRVVALRRR